MRQAFRGFQELIIQADGCAHAPKHADEASICQEWEAVFARDDRSAGAALRRGSTHALTRNPAPQHHRPGLPPAGGTWRKATYDYKLHRSGGERTESRPMNHTERSIFSEGVASFSSLKGGAIRERRDGDLFRDLL